MVSKVHDGFDEEGSLKGCQLANSPLKTVILNHPILIEKDDEMILLVLDPRV